MDKISVQARYEKFLSDNGITGLDEKQDYFLRRLFFAGFTCYRDLTLLELQEMTHEEALSKIFELDEELATYWGESSKFSI